VLEFLVVLAVLAAAVWLIAAPLRRPAEDARETSAAEEGDREALEAAKAAKYAEIRDAELDHRTGKLSDDDWHELDSQLRAEALELLRRQEELGEATAGPDPQPPGETAER
jgi:hypothetical protein